MKQILLLIMAISCAGFILAQDIIVTKAGINIEDVTVLSVAADYVTYNQAGAQKTIASSEVEGVLYSNGRYMTPPTYQTIPAEETISSDDTWAVDDAPSGDTQSSSKVHREKREKKERGNSEVGKAFKNAGVAIKDAFTTMFDAMGKKKDKSSSETTTKTTTTSNDTDTESNQSTTAASDDGW